MHPQDFDNRLPGDVGVDDIAVVARQDQPVRPVHVHVHPAGSMEHRRVPDRGMAKKYCACNEEFIA